MKDTLSQKSEKKFYTIQEAVEKISIKKIRNKIYKRIELKRNIFIKTLNSTTTDALTKLKKLYDYADEFNLPFIEDSVCQKGCIYCCLISVDISEIEVQYIERNTKYKRKNHEEINKNKKCPFLNLVDNACMVYNYRPLACRCFFTFDNPSYCKSDEPHVITQLKSIEEIQTSYYNLLKSVSIPILRDIRDYF